MKKENLQEKLSIAIENCSDLPKAIHKFIFSPKCSEEVGRELLTYLK